LLAVVVEAELGTDVTMFAVAQDIVQERGRNVEFAMHVFCSGRTHKKALVEAFNEAWQEGVAGFPVYEIICDSAESLGGLLLYRCTALAGALSSTWSARLALYQ
jgi:hypothetical protein